MKAVFIAVLIVVMLGGTSCEMEDKLFHFVAHYSHMGPLDYDHTGSDTQELRITSDDLKDALDIPRDATVTGVDVQSLALRLEVLEGNSAQFVDLEGQVSGTVGDSPIFREFDYPVPLVGVDVPLGGINSLIAGGVAELRQQLENLVLGDTQAAALLQVEMTPRGIGNRVHVRLHLRIDVSVKYDECIEVPKDFFDGPDCPTGSGD